MEIFFLVPTSVYKKNLKTRSVKKLEPPKYQPLQNPTYQIDSLKKEINRNMFAKTNLLVDKVLSCPRTKLSNSQIFILDGAENGVSLSDFPQQLRRKNVDVQDFYLTLLDAAGMSPTPILNQNLKDKRRGIWVSLKI